MTPSAQWAACVLAAMGLAAVVRESALLRRPRGWVGLRLDVDRDWDEVAGVVEECWRRTAPRRLVAEYDEIATGPQVSE